MRLSLLLIAIGVSASLHAEQVVDLKAPDGTSLRASYFAAAKRGPGVLLLHQSNRDRSSWRDVAQQLAGEGINTLTLDTRGHGDSAGPPFDKLSHAEQIEHSGGSRQDFETALQFLMAQPGVDRDLIGIGGAGAFGVLNAVRLAQKNPAAIKSLVLISGEALRDGMQFLHDNSRLPELCVVSDLDEYPPTVEAMELLYDAASNPGRKFVHYAAAEEAPWIWYEPFDIGRVKPAGNHGTDLFDTHRELPGIVVHWFVTTLIKTPGHAPADGIACAATIDEIRTGGAARVAARLREARRKDPAAQLFPEITVSIIGQDDLRERDPARGLEVLNLVLLAYPDSADAHETLAEADLANGDKAMARQHAEKALSILDAHNVPASSWTDTDPYRGEIRSAAQNVLKKASAAK